MCKLPYVNEEETIHFPPAKDEIKKTVRTLADRIIRDTRFGFRVGKEEYFDGSSIPAGSAPQLLSPHTDWKYWNGVINIGMYRLGELLDEESYLQHPSLFFEFAIENLSFFKELYDQHIPGAPFHQYFRMDRLDDCGALGAALVETFQRNPEPQFKRRIEQTAEYMGDKQDRLPDGTFVRRRFGKTTMWADDLYMSVPFMSRYYRYSGNVSYLDDAIIQVKNFYKCLFSEHTGLYHHCWYADTNSFGVAHWGRANGWVAMALCDLLEFMPADHPEREEVRGILFRQIIGFARYQSASGMWRQLLDKTDSWLESSVTAMFTYAVAKAVNMNWIDNMYSSIAVQGWKGLAGNISDEGILDNVSTGFNIKQDLPFYYNIPVEPGGAHGLGAVMLAGAEMLKLREYRDCVWC